MPSSTIRIPLVDQIEALLPQTQCGKCLHPGCRPYAEAIAQGEAINHCVPGGASTIAELAQLLNTPALPLDPTYGVSPSTHRVAFIREAECIGCTKCIQACPVDAIVGAAKLMHTVIRDECTGCDLCVAPCPVDCIDMVDLPLISEPAQKKQRATHARARYEFRRQRLHAALSDKNPAPIFSENDARQNSVASAPLSSKPASEDNKSSIIAAALARSNLKKSERKLMSAQESGEDTQVLQAEIQRLKAEVARLSRKL